MSKVLPITFFPENLSPGFRYVCGNSTRTDLGDDKFPKSRILFVIPFYKVRSAGVVNAVLPVTIIIKHAAAAAAAEINNARVNRVAAH